jgi:NAD-dependent deacetylase
MQREPGVEDWQIRDAAALIQGAKRVVALTGAGISTPSGIPDFRSDSGLWEHYDPIEVASLQGFLRNPERFYDWFRPLLHILLTARPNPAHHALAQLEKWGKLRAVVTQNIDGLHQRAGSREVFELHGHLRSATCPNCGSQVAADYVIEHALRDEMAYCRCGHVYKPDVVLFDEMLPMGLFWLAEREFATADLIVIVGTSLEVYPASDLPLNGLQKGAKLLIVNKSSTPLDSRADVLIHGDAAAILPAIVKELAPVG